jgi:chitin synthase
MISECFPGSDLNSGDFSKISKLTERLYSSGALAKDEELAHLFSQRVKFDNGVFLNLMFCVKHENKRKLNTHKWFFEGFCKIINPLYIALLDVGTRPREKGLYYLYKALHYDKRTAGCCGEIIPQTKFSNILVMAQMVEYKISHIFDKAVESHIGYISVLPGAFSAYRWEAINRPEIMNIYFRSQRRGEKLDMFQANMYLAEDRILCLELMCQEKRSNFLRYVKESIAETDVPESLNELLAQRRRWINGSWFSMIYAIRRCNKIDTSGHSTTTKIFFKLLMIYYSLASLFSWLLVGALYFSFTVTFNFLKSKSRGDYKEILEYATGSILFLYTGLLIITLIYSFAVKPKKVENHLWWMSFILGGLTLLNMGNVGLTIRIGIKDIEPGENYLDTMKYFMMIFIPGTFILILILSCFNGIKETLKLAYGLPFYFCVMGIYYNIFTIYAISNTHDCSWGNRPDKRTDEENQLVFRYKNERTRWALVWIFSNLLFVKVCTYLGLNDDKYGIAFLLFLSALVIIPTTLKFLMALFYLTSERISKSRKSRLSINN